MVAQLPRPLNRYLCVCLQARPPPGGYGPGPGMARVANRAIGLNYIDTYHRSGLYPLPLPTGIGLEGAGVVEAVGEGVDLPVGTRVGYCAAGIGAYAEAINLPASRLVALPETVDFETAAAVLLKGCTVEYLLQRTWPLAAGETCLFHAAAGGVGQLFGQWAASLGATVIGTVGSAEKAELARACGYHHVINYREESVVERVRELTGGAGLPVVYDGVGQATLMGSLDSLAPLGLLASFGSASGAITGLDLGLLAPRGSLYVTRPTLATFTSDRATLEEAAARLFKVVRDGAVKIAVNATYPMAEAQQVHRDLAGRETTGSIVMLP